MPSWRVHQGWLLPPMVGNEIAPVAQLGEREKAEALLRPREREAGMPSWRVHQGWLLPPMVGNEIAPVAQLDRVLASEARGRGFKSRRARQFPQPAHAAVRSSICCNTLWVTFSCLSGGWPYLRRMRFTSARG